MLVEKEEAYEGIEGLSKVKINVRVYFRAVERLRDAPVDPSGSRVGVCTKYNIT